MGVNPRGLAPSAVWQTDVTVYEPFKPNSNLFVTTDTYSGVLVVTAKRRARAKEMITHWQTAMTWLGKPGNIKTDNGPNFVAQSVK